MNIKELFDAASESYDQTRKKYIACFDDLYGAAIDQIPFNRKDEFSILDLGAGTGLLSALVIEAFPEANMTLSDISGDMIVQARTRFKESNKIKYAILDYVNEKIAGSYDVVISALSIHHTPHEKLAFVFRNIHDSLRNRGIFINADQILGQTTKIEKCYEDAWLRHAKQAGCTQEEIDTAIERMKADKTTTLGTQLGLLTEVGFRDVNCWYQFYRYATYSGIKRSDSSSLTLEETTDDT